MKKALLLLTTAGVLLAGINGLATAGKAAREVGASTVAEDTATAASGQRDRLAAKGRGAESASMVVLGTSLLGLATLGRRKLPR